MADLALVDAPFGLEPWGPMRPNACHYYTLATTPTVALFHGDMVKFQGTALLTPHMGNLRTVENEVPSTASTFAGIILGLFDDTMKPMLHMPISEAGNGTIAGYVFVCDDPDQEYIVQEDGGASSIVIDDIGETGDLIVAAGSTTTGLSKTVLDSSDVHAGGGSTGCVKVIGVHPEDTISAAGAASNYARFIVRINTAAWDTNVAGV